MKCNVGLKSQHGFWQWLGLMPAIVGVIALHAANAEPIAPPPPPPPPPADNSERVVCVNGDLAGNWFWYVTFVDANYSDIGMVRCKMVLDKFGNVLVPNSSCVLRNYTRITVTGGQITVDAACAVTGSINTSFQGYDRRVQITNARLEPNTKGAMTGFADEYIGDQFMGYNRIVGIRQ